jgi:chromate transport protein ChrA
VLPGFGIMLVFTFTYAYLGATPTMRAGLNGLGPVVLGIFTVAVYRLGRASVTTIPDLGGIDLGSDFQAHTEGLFQLVFKEAAILLGLDQLLLKAMLWGKT